MPVADEAESVLLSVLVAIVPVGKFAALRQPVSLQRLGPPEVRPFNGSNDGSARQSP